ncbi:uncharacterized protein N7484_002884 [Penicillium longicatenatum]|uniref:uncharacterized protein n=1 Tax=Penicillium longicatenatum TaxID=1561947 RepID=UPI002547E700|nr:uncharacterized protein N7484_002884 [Penicillium longicatenatum]KAJ5649161.1 hypothetical protein N7484_002884 [Penicillium longicatenatum]
MYLFKTQLQSKSHKPLTIPRKRNYPHSNKHYSIFHTPNLATAGYHPLTDLPIPSPSSLTAPWAFACLSHVIVASRQWVWGHSDRHPGGIITMEEWEWEVDGADPQAQDSVVADQALAREVALGLQEVDDEVDAAKT